MVCLFVFLDIQTNRPSPSLDFRHKNIRTKKLSVISYQFSVAGLNCGMIGDIFADNLIISQQISPKTAVLFVIIC